MHNETRDQDISLKSLATLRAGGWVDYVSHPCGIEAGLGPPHLVHKSSWSVLDAPCVASRSRLLRCVRLALCVVTALLQTSSVIDSGV